MATGCLGVGFTAYLFMVTKGPVFQLRLELAPMTGDFIDDVWVQTAFVAISAAVIGMAWPARRRLTSDRPLVWAFGSFGLVVLASTLWSVFPPRAFQQGFMLSLGITAALLAGSALSTRAALVSVWAATQAGVLASLWAQWRRWPRATDQFGDLAGIYFNRNSMAPVALVAAASALVLAASLARTDREGQRGTLAIVVGLVLLGILNLYTWWGTGSLTPAAGVSVAAAVTAAVALLRPGGSVRLRRVGIGVAALLAVATIAAFRERDRFVADGATFSGRTEIWAVVWDFASRRPFQGWGFMSIWRDEQSTILGELWLRYVLVTEAHSGYLEVMLGVGLVGLALLLAALVVALVRGVQAMWALPSIETSWIFGVICYGIAVNFGETYVGANLLPWTLLTMAASQASRLAQGSRPGSVRLRSGRGGEDVGPTVRGGSTRE